MADVEHFGPYVLEQFLAAGGMAEVFLARRSDGTPPGRFAIKRMLAEMMKTPEYATMFKDEAALAARLQHPNIVHVFDFGEIAGRMFMAMEFVDGLDVGTLQRTLRTKHELLSVANALKIGVELCSGLYYAHTLPDDRGRPLRLIHRDISPQNIMLSLRGEVKITDFGIAKATGRETKTATGMIKGKVQYMAPEQALGQQIDQRVDQFAAGIVLWELLVGQRLFAEKSDLLTFEKIIRQATPKPSSMRSAVPPFVDEVVLRALAKNPGERFHDMNAFGVALAQCSAKLGGGASADLAPVIQYVMQPTARAPALAVASRAPLTTSPPERALLPTVVTPHKDATPAQVAAALSLADRGTPRGARAASLPSASLPSAALPSAALPSAAFDATVAVLPPRSSSSSSPALSSSGLTLGTQAGARAPIGIEPQSRAASSTHIVAASAPKGTPIALMIAAALVGVVVGVVGAKATAPPKARDIGCGVPSTNAARIDQAYALLGTANALLEASDLVGAQAKAGEANAVSASARGHFILMLAKQRGHEAAGTVAHMRCVLELGAGGDDAARVERMVLAP